MAAGGKEGASAEVKVKWVKEVCSIANFYHLFNLLLRVICQTVAAVPAPPSLVHSNEQPGKIIPFPKDQQRGRVDDNGPEKWGNCAWITSQDTKAVHTLCTQEMRLINTCSQGQWEDLPHDDGEARISAASFLRQVAGQYWALCWVTVSTRFHLKLVGELLLQGMKTWALYHSIQNWVVTQLRNRRKGKQRGNII